MAAGLADAQITKDLFTASEVMKWYVNNIVDAPGEEATAPETQDLKHHQTRVEKARSEKEMLKVDDLLGDYTEFSDMSDSLIELGDLFVDILEPMPSAIAELIIGSSETDIRIVIENYVRATLQKRSNNDDT
jgi:hypothetical protein